MVSKFTQRNKFGKVTWEIEFVNIFPIRIQETNDNSYIVDFFERNFYIFNKTIFSFVSSKSLEDVVIEAVDRVYLYILKRKGINWTLQQKEKFLKETLADIQFLNRQKNEI